MTKRSWWLLFQQKLFVVPKYTDEQRDIPFGRVNHNKYMVTDRVAYIGELYYFQTIISSLSLAFFANKP